MNRNSSALISAPVSQGGTFDVPLPAGFAPGDIGFGAGHTIVAAGGVYYAPVDFIARIMPDRIRVLWNRAGGLPAGATVHLALGVSATDTAASRRRGQAIMSWRPTSIAEGLVSAGFTVHLAMALEGAFDAVQLVYENDAAATTMNIDAAAVAASAKWGNRYDPVDAAGAAQAWTAVTFNNLGVAGDIPSPAGSTAGIADIAIAADVAVPTRVYSDWMAVPSLDRADTSEANPLLFVRTLTGALGTFRAANSNYIATAWASDINNLGRYIFEAHKTGDYVTANQADFVGASPVVAGYIAPAAVRYLSRSLGAVVMGVGDSLTASNGVAAFNMRGYGFLACTALSSLARPVQWHNEAWPGLTSARYYARGLSAIPVIKPRVSILQTMSGNEANATVEVAEGAWSRAMTLGSLTRIHGGVPVFVTPYPRNYAATAEAFRQATITRLRAMAAAGSILVIDADALLADPATPNRIRDEYYVEGTHINAAGELAMANIAAPVIEAAL